MAPAKRIAELEAELAELRQSNAELRRLLAELQAKLGMSSLNSSLPPSRDDAESRGRRREKAKSAKHARRRKKDARRKNRAECMLFPPERLTSSQESRPNACPDCGVGLGARDLLPEPERIQQYDFGHHNEVLVHEVRIYSAKCPGCQTVTKGSRGRNVFAFLRDLLSPNEPNPSLLPAS